MIARKGHVGGSHINTGAQSQQSNVSSSNGGQASAMGGRSDNVTLPVDLTAESSSVSSLSRKIQNTGEFIIFRRITVNNIYNHIIRFRQVSHNRLFDCISFFPKRFGYFDR